MRQLVTRVLVTCHGLQLRNKTSFVVEKASRSVRDLQKNAGDPISSPPPSNMSDSSNLLLFLLDSFFQRRIS